MSALGIQHRDACAQITQNDQFIEVRLLYNNSPVERYLKTNSPILDCDIVCLNYEAETQNHKQMN